MNTNEFVKLNKIGMALEILNFIHYSEFTNEDVLSDFLKKLSIMNANATKGYMQDRSHDDDVVYSIKALAVDFVISQCPSRCFYSLGFDRDVIYVYSKGRQFSYHCRLNDEQRGRIKNAEENGVVWNRIENGCIMTDAEYVKAISDKIARNKTKRIVPRTKQTDFLEKLEKYKKDKSEKRKREISKQREEYFFSVLDKSKFSKNVCVRTRNYDKCRKLYAEKLSLPEYNKWSYVWGEEQK